MSEMIFSAYIPTKLIFGTGEVAKLAETPLPGKKALVVISAGTSMRKYGYLDRVLEMLHKNEVQTVVYDKILANPVKGREGSFARCCHSDNGWYGYGNGPVGCHHQRGNERKNRFRLSGYIPGIVGRRPGNDVVGSSKVYCLSRI